MSGLHDMVTESSNMSTTALSPDSVTALESGYAHVSRQRDVLLAFVNEERERLLERVRRSTHWDGCEKGHRDCARLVDIDALLKATS